MTRETAETQRTERAVARNGRIRFGDGAVRFAVGRMGPAGRSAVSTGGGVRTAGQPVRRAEGRIRSGNGKTRTRHGAAPGASRSGVRVRQTSGGEDGRPSPRPEKRSGNEYGAGRLAHGPEMNTIEWNTVMYYYNPNDRSPRRWAVIAAALYVLTLGTAFAFVSFDFRIGQRTEEAIWVDFTEPPVPEPPAPLKRTPTEPRMHDAAAPAEQTAEVAGRDEKTETPNPRALFKMNKGGADAPDDAGNPHAPEGEDKASGRGPGLSTDGLDQLDRGLQGRGLRGALPKPSYPGNRGGKVVVRVTVGPAGEVTSAAYEPKGSTTSDPSLIEAALAAARKAKFTESRAPVQGGTITYVFKLK